MLNQNEVKQTKEGIIFKVKVLPNSSRFEVLEFDPWLNASRSNFSKAFAGQKVLRVKVQSPALEGQANKELLEKLSEFFSTQIEMVQGQKSSEKVLLAYSNSAKISAFLKPNSTNF